MLLLKRLFVVYLFILLPVFVFAQTKDTVVDSHYTWKELQEKFIAHYTDTSKIRMSSYQRTTAVLWVNEKLSLVDVLYFGFDNKIHRGQIVCHKSAADDVKNIFNELMQMQFPVQQCKPICEFDFSDLQSMQANNTSGFDFRFKTGSRTLSKHSYGLAIDINPVENPYKKGREILPENNSESTATGRIRITEEQGRKVIAIFRKYGWTWGGNWSSLKDYMHFEKS